MAKSHALYLTDHHLEINEVGTDGIQTVFTRAYDSAGWQEEIRGFLDQNQFGRVSVFVDVMGEEIKHESIPHISGKDRELLLNRKLKSAFPSADFTWKRHQGRKKNGRKDDEYLLLGVTLPASVHSVLDIFEASQKRIVGIYLLSALQQQLSVILPSQPQYLIISGVTESNKSKRTFRQTYYKDNVLTLSRLNNLLGNSEKDLHQQLLGEIERTYQFLASSRQIDQGLVLNVIVILNKDEAAGLININVNPNIDLKYANLNDLSEKMGIKDTLSCKTLPDLLCSFAIRKSLKPHFQPAGLCSQFRVDLTKRNLNFSSVVIILLAVITSVILWQKTAEVFQHSQHIDSSLDKIETQRGLLSSTLPKTDIPPKVMEQAVRLYKSIGSDSRKPGFILDVLARAYNGYQDIEITKILWIGDGRSINSIGSTDADKNNTLSFISRMNAKGQIKVTIRPDNQLGARGMLERVDSFSASLLQQPEISTVTREKSAIDTSSTALLEQSFGKGTSDKFADFTLLITM